MSSPVRVWGSEAEKILIDFYRDHKLLWHTKHPDNSKRGIREYLLQKLCKELQKHDTSVGINDVKMKFKNLRTTYQREKRKVEGSSAYCPKWYLYDSMKFLSEVSCDASIDSLEEEEYKYEVCDPLEDESFDANALLTSGPTILPDVIDETSYQGPPPKKVTMNEKKMQVLNGTVEAVNTVVSQLQEAASHEEDGMDLFCGSVAVSLKKLSPINQEMAKLDIQKVVLKYVQQELTGKE